MTDREIEVLLDNPNITDHNNRDALGQIPFERVRAIMENRYERGTLIKAMYSIVQAQDQVEMTTCKPYDEDLMNFRQAAAFFWNMVAGMQTDVYNFASFALELWRNNRLSGPYQQALEPLLQIPYRAYLHRETKDALKIQSVRPRNYVMQVDNVFRHLPDLQEENEVYAGSKGRRQINTLVNLSLPEQYKLEGQDHMDAYDKAVLNGVNSLLESGSVNFTIPMLYHAMTGKNNPTVDKVLLNELRRRLEMMRRTLITIDLRQELEARYVELHLTEPQMQGYLLPLTQYSARVNGKLVQVYHLLDTPPMLAYAKLKRQLATVPITLLDAPLNNNATTIPLKNYLISRCESMRNPNNKVNNNKILFESIYAELGEADAGKVRKKRIRDYTATILQHMKDEQYIRSFSFTEKGRSIDGIQVTFYREKPPVLYQAQAAANPEKEDEGAPENSQTSSEPLPV